MILSHRHRFIFVKTGKTAGTSVKIALAKLCGDEDVVPPTMDPTHDLVPRNDRGRVNPLPELLVARRAGIVLDAAGTKAMLVHGTRFSGHSPAWLIRARAPRAWREYRTFCVERNPWDKVRSGRAWLRTQYGHDWDVDTYLDWIEGRIAKGYHGTGVSPYNFASYTDPRTGEVIVDRILRYERLHDELPELLDELGLPQVELPRVYGDRRRRDDDPLTPEQVERIGRIFAAEIALHGYEPPVAG